MDVSAGIGTVLVNGVALSSNQQNYSFDIETKVKLEAIPAVGYDFFQWGGYVVSSENPIIIFVDCSKTITATFISSPPVLTMEKQGSGTISPTTGNHRTYWQGEQVKITALPESGWKFDGWSNNVDNPHSLVTSVTLNSDMTVIAYFSRILPVWLIPVAVTADVIVIGMVTWLLFWRKPARKAR